MNVINFKQAVFSGTFRCMKITSFALWSSWNPSSVRWHSLVAAWGCFAAYLSAVAGSRLWLASLHQDEGGKAADGEDERPAML